ncbi:hypothetical protein BB559_007544 [Furculomyces boomerangus]|uniref:acetyl-CoA C-acetyltransferase n=1 Tax=Furculomyces boomerangus TaxID=61424 RepID=A0A2T9XWY3_9FUNG|nr:hypothetical protein BB559_007544 [Furculomyces boomerangus]
MNVFITSAVRTPTGSFLGAVKSLSASKLGAVAIKGALEKSGISGDQVNEVYMGQVIQGGEGQAPTSQTATLAGIPTTVPCTTINKVCASGMKSIMLAAQNIQLGITSVMVAGGMESMSNAPYIAPRGATFGNQTLKDLLVHDGLTNPGNSWLMGNCSEKSAQKHSITRDMQDTYATSSYERALNAINENLFSEEISPIKISGKKGDVVFSVDEEPSRVKFDKFKSLRPVFSKDGTITAANASKLSDGASATVLMSEDMINKLGGKTTPLARIVSYADANTDPIDFSSAPVLAIPIALQRANLALKDIAKWEINEAFAVVPLIAHKVLGIPLEILNTKGGAIALGHPLGSSGSRIVTTLIHQLKPGEFGCAAICNGGGGASAIVVQRV